MSKAPSIIVGIDLGNSSLKAVRLQKRGAQYALTRVATLPSQRDPVNPTPPTEQSLANQIKELASLVRASGADVHYTINSPNSTVRYVELPRIPLQEVRSALKLNSATYLRQNFENYTFDACPLDAEAAEILRQGKGPKASPAGSHGKVKTLVGGIVTPEIMLYFHASRRAGIKPRSLQLAPISLINGFEASYPEVFRTQAVALLDLGFLSSSLTILDQGTPLLTRAVPMGGKQITEYIAQISNLDFAKAEASKLQGDAGLNDAVARTAVTLVREVRSSINFFEKNSDQPISKVYLTGASLQSPVVMEALSNDIGTACEVWNPTQGLAVDLPVEQQNIFGQNPTSFSTALGAARTHAGSGRPKLAVDAAPKPQPEKT